MYRELRVCSQALVPVARSKILINADRDIQSFQIPQLTTVEREIVAQRTQYPRIKMFILPTNGNFKGSNILEQVGHIATARPTRPFRRVTATRRQRAPGPRQSAGSGPGFLGERRSLRRILRLFLTLGHKAIALK